MFDGQKQTTEQIVKNTEQITELRIHVQQNTLQIVNNTEQIAELKNQLTDLKG